MAHVIHCPVMEFWSIGTLILFIRSMPRLQRLLPLQLIDLALLYCKNFGLSICRKLNSLVCLLFCLTHIFHFCFSGNCVYLFAMLLVVVSFFCVAIITPFSCHVLLIPTPLALSSFLSIVFCAVSSSVLFFISFLFLYRFC